MIEILYCVAAMVVLAALIGVALALAAKHLTVKEDPRKDKVMSLMPNANCGACGYPGCAGLVDAFIKGKETRIKKCGVIKEEQAEEIAEYLNTTPDNDGNVLKVTIK